eukprot:1057569-Prorocentrum_lima.AAC.1
MRNGTGSTLACRLRRRTHVPWKKAVVIDHVKANAAKVKAVKCKEKYTTEPSCDGVDPAEPSSTLQWGVP